MSGRDKDLVRVGLRSMAGELLELEAELASTVAELEARIGECWGIPHMKLVHGREVLGGADALGSHCEEGATFLSLTVIAVAPDPPPAETGASDSPSCAFDFDALEAEGAGAEARVVETDGAGRARGQCRACDCAGWLGSAEAAGSSGPRAYNAVFPHGAGVGPAQPGELEGPGADALPGLLPEHRQGGACQRCGCAAAWHEDLSHELAGLWARGALVEAGEGWSELERALYVRTGGAVHPGVLGRDARARSAVGAGETLVSVICPTEGVRRPFHPSLYRCFCCQVHIAAELVVIDTGDGTGPSDFFTRGPPKSDPRVVYRYFDVPGLQWSVGTKRNIACSLASGEVIVHFDDDDLYAPQYLARVLRVLSGGGDGEIECVDGVLASIPGSTSPPYGHSSRDDDADSPSGSRAFAVDALALASWTTFHLASGDFGMCDAGTERRVDGRLSRRLDRMWAYGYGFSLAYTRDAWRRRWFRNLRLGEDSDFIEGVVARGGRVALVQGGRELCVHGLHDQNASEWWSNVGVERAPPPGELAEGPSWGSPLARLALQLRAEVAREERG